MTAGAAFEAAAEAPLLWMTQTSDGSDASTTAESEQDANSLLDASEYKSEASEPAPTSESTTASPKHEGEEVEDSEEAEEDEESEVSTPESVTNDSVADAISVAGEEFAEDHTIYALAKILEHMAKACKPSSDNESKSYGFHSVRVPKVSLSSYASRIQKYFRCTDECFVLCLVYIDRIVKHNPDIQVTDLSCHRLLLTGCMVAAKFHDDEYASNEYFAKVGGIETKELNALEAEFLQLLDWKVFVRRKEYDWFHETLRSIS